MTFAASSIGHRLFRGISGADPTTATWFWQMSLMDIWFPTSWQQDFRPFHVWFAATWSCESSSRHFPHFASQPDPLSAGRRSYQFPGPDLCWDCDRHFWLNSDWSWESGMATVWIDNTMTTYRNCYSTSRFLFQLLRTEYCSHSANQRCHHARSPQQRRSSHRPPPPPH